MKSVKQIRAKYHAQFKQILRELNKDQRAAVEQIEGPVLTIAGPGTGKTHILSARIGQILLKTDTLPQNILCLTFTDAAVRAMRKRLLDFIGPEAHRVHIYTFHSFCNKVIQENLDYFGQQRLEPISDLERVEFIRELIDSLDVEHPLRKNRSTPYSYEGHLQKLFALMKKENWTADYINGYIEKQLEDALTDPAYRYKRNAGTFKKGDLKQGDLEKLRKNMDNLRAGAFLFEEYKDLLLKKQRYDYEDMIQWVLRAFEEEEYLLRTYQEQYLYVLVDEFQDTNGMQSQIIQQLIAYWEEKPNVFIVGDDDQSIYEFQGARMKNMLDFYEQYKANLSLYVLRENYRSTQWILDASKGLIDQNELRIIKQIKASALGLDKNLQSAKEQLQHLKIPVKVVAYPNKRQEEIDLVRQIKELEQQGVALNEVAVIYAKHRQAEEIIRLLEQHKVPYHTKRRINILTLPIVENLINLMNYILAEFAEAYSGEPYFYEILHYEFVGISPRDVYTLQAYFVSENKSRRLKGEYDNLLRWRDLMQDDDLLEQLGLEDVTTVQALGRFLREISYAYLNVSTPALFEQIINQSGLLDYMLNGPEKLWALDVINTLFDFVKGESLKDAKFDLWGLLELVNRMQDNHLSLSLSKVDYSEDGVQLMTAHSAKGLEFKYVFMINCVREYWEPRSGGSRFQFTLPDSLILSNESDEMEAARRLFYVAMTRAKTHLHISYHLQNEQAKKSERSCFLDELENESRVEFKQGGVAKELLIDWQSKLLKNHVEPIHKILQRNIVDGLLANFSLSVSALNSYLACPLSFYYEFVLRLPQTVSTEANYGIAVHNALKRIFDRYKVEEGLLGDTKQLLFYVKEELQGLRAYLTDSAYFDLLDWADRQIPPYYLQRKLNWEQALNQGEEVLCERPFRNIELEGVPLNGVIDKVIVRKSEGQKYLHVVDYKTGRIKKSDLSKPSKRKPYGGKYWRQLVFYKILLEQSRTFPVFVKTAEIDYLTEDEMGVYPQKQVRISEKDVDLVKGLIVETYQKIQAREFEQGCGKSNCKWCNFSKQQRRLESYRNEELETLDD